MKLYKKNIAILMASILALSSGALVTSCDDDDDYDTNQFKGGVSLTAASLQVTRGAYMTFKGIGLDQITSVQFPGGVSSKPEVVDQYTIKALVPEEAEIGTVKLIYSGGELETKQIAFTEPITFDDFKADADPVLAGQNVTVTGTYLTYIEFVQFATGENVPVNNDSRTTLKVQVPLDASTGKFNLGYYSVDGTDTTEVLLESKTELNVVVPTEVKVTNPDAKAGQKLNIAGKNLQLVQYVNLPGVDPISVVDPSVKDKFAAVSALNVVLPAEAQAGNVTLTLYSGLEIAAGSLSPLTPKAAIKDAQSSYAVGDTVLISGSDLDLVKAISFTSGVEASFNLVGDVLKVVVSQEAQSGDITLALANGVTIPVSGFVTTKPVVTFPDAVTPLDKLSLSATLADRVVSVKFGDVVAEATAKDGKINVQVPLDALDQCAVILVMDNGEEVSVKDALAVNGYTFCAFKDAVAFQAQTPTVGTLASGIVVNGGNLENVLLNGKDTKFIMAGETLYVYIGAAAGEQTVTLVTGETEVNYTINVIASGVVETVVWNGPLEITWGDGGRVVVTASDLEGVPAGSILRLYFNGKDGVWAQAQLNNGKWNKDLLGILVPSDVEEYNWWGGGAAEDHVHEIVLTSEILAHLRENAGSFEDIPDAALIIQGSDLIFSKVSIVVDYSAPKSIVLSEGTDAGGWKLPVELTWSDGGRLVVYKNNPVDLSSLVKVGATLHIVTSNRHGQCQINNSSWSTIETVADWDNEGEFTYEVPITQAYVDAFNADGDIWLILQGDSGFTITDMYIK
ncbi:MAG: hypothetical protein PUJ24_07915 [Bacteroidales bacterium]|nr:hypothetical protein [Bacteroidales bacterium]